MRSLKAPQVGSKQFLNSSPLPRSYTLSPSVAAGPLMALTSAAVASSPVLWQLAISPAASSTGSGAVVAAGAALAAGGAPAGGGGVGGGASGAGLVGLVWAGSV